MSKHNQVDYCLLDDTYKQFDGCCIRVAFECYKLGMIDEETQVGPDHVSLHDAFDQAIEQVLDSYSCGECIGCNNVQYDHCELICINTI